MKVDAEKPYLKPIYVARFGDKFRCPFTVRCNPYLNCVHNCSYCYARHIQEVKHLWGTIRPADVSIITKAIHGAYSGKLNSEMHKLIRKKVPLHLGVMTDGFQECERDFGITYQILEACKEHSHPVVATTKGTVCADQKYIDLMKDAPVIVQFSFSTDEDLVAARFESGAPSPTERFEAIKKLTAAGITAQIRIAPLLPIISEPAVMRILDKAPQIGVHEVMTDWLKQFRTPDFRNRLSKAAGYDYIQGLRDAKYPIRIDANGDAHLETDHITRLHRIWKAVADSKGVDLLVTPDPLGEINNYRCCCGVDKYPGFSEGLVRAVYRMNGRRIDFHTNFDQYMYGHTDKIEPGSRLMKDFWEWWESGELQYMSGGDFIYHPEDKTYSRKTVLEQRGMAVAQVSVERC